MLILSAQKMREIEQKVVSKKVVTRHELIIEAIGNAYDALMHDPEFSRFFNKELTIVVYAGKGLNAADAIGLAGTFRCRQVVVRFATAFDEVSRPVKTQFKIIDRNQLFVPSSLPKPAPFPCLIIDGLLGSGAHGTLADDYAELVREMNALRASHPCNRTIAVDIPTGLDPDSGKPGPDTVRADATLAIGCVKSGLVIDGAEDFVGRLLCVALPSLPLPPSRIHAIGNDFLSRLPERPQSFYKNRAGRVQIIAGSPGYIGAAQMCGEAALNAGAGLVELYCLRDIYPLLAVRVAAEVMVHAVDSYDEVPVERANALLVGPGLGKPDAPQIHALQKLIQKASCPVVMDADALNLAAAGKLTIPHGAVITPHPGEMLRLFPQSSSLSRSETARQFVKKNDCILLLKGARSIVATRHSLCFNTSGGPYMASGGHGDVLSGVIAALLAQGMPPQDAAATGAYLCGLAATHAYATQGFPRSVRATSLYPFLGARD